MTTNQESLVWSKATDWLEMFLESGERLPGSLAITLLFGLVLMGWYYVFWKPLDYYLDFTKTGFDEVNYAKRRNYKTDSAKREAINDLMRRRKAGDVPPPYPNGWFVILESDDLTTGNTREVNVLGLNLVAWRGQSGKAYIADAYCKHLGAHLGVGGKVQGECIRCPFHGWECSGCDGRLKKIPYSETQFEKKFYYQDAEFAKLKIWKTIEGNGFIYLCYHAEGDEPTWVPHIYPEIESGTWKYRGRCEFNIACHIQEFLENAADIAHLNVLHQDSPLAGGDPYHSCFQSELMKQIWSNPVWKPIRKDGETHKGKLEVCNYVQFFGRYNFFMVDVHATMVGPGLVNVELNNAFFGKGVMLLSFTPLEPLRQQTLHRLYTSTGSTHPMGKLVLLIEVVQLYRDIKIWNRKTYLRNPLFTKEDRYIKEMRQWYSQFYTKNSTKSYIPSISNTNPLEL